MALRTIFVVGINGDGMQLETPTEQISCWRIMCAIKKETNIPKREQKILLGGVILKPRDAVPDNITLTRSIVITTPTWDYCGTESGAHELMFCAGCLDVFDCNTHCHAAGWNEHSLVCGRRCNPRDT